MYYASAAIRDNEELVPSSPENALLPPRSSAFIPTLQRDQSEALSVPDPSRSQPKAKVLWSSGLFDCFSDVRNCCITCWCPCITFGQIAETVDKGIPTCGMNGALYALIACGNGCCCLYSCFYRPKLKQQLSIKETPCCEYVIVYRSESGQRYTIKETPCWDCLVHCFCECCALCQEYRELHTRGLLMSTGNKIKEFNGRLMAPVMEEGMKRDE